MKRRDGRNRIVIGVILGALLVLAGARGGLGPVRWLYDHTVVPIGRGVSGAGTSTNSFFSTLGQVGQLSAQNAKLRSTNDQLRSRLAADADAMSQNAQLRQELGLVQLGAPKQVGADVVAFQPDSYRQFVTIDRGSRDGLKVGQAALSNGIVVGTVSQVSASTAQVQLVSDPEFAITVRDEQTGALGVLHGQLGGGLEVDDIQQSDKVKPGDDIATSGLGGVVPSGLFIGPVQAVNGSSGGIFISAQVTPSVESERLRFVFVVQAS